MLRCAVLLLAASCTRAPSASEWPVARLGFQRVGPYRAYFVAEEKGFFREEQVRVEGTEFPSSNVLGQAQVAGRVDGSGFISFPVLFALEQNAPGQSVCELVLPMTKASRFAAIVVPAASPARGPEDLKGRKVGVYPSSTNVIFARLMLQKLFGSADAAQLLQIDPATQFQLLESGGVDALIGPDPMPATAVARKVGRVLTWAPDAQFVMDPMPVGCATLSKAYADRQPEAAKRVRRALERAVDFLREPANRAEVLAIVGRRAGLDPAVASGLGEVDYWKLAETDARPVQALADLLQREGVLAGHVDVAALLGAR